MKQPNSDNASARPKTPSLVKSSDEAWQHGNRQLALGLIALIIIESYLSPLIAVVSAGNPDRYTNLYYLHATVAFSLIVLGVVVFGNSGLQAFHDHFSAWTIVLSCYTTALLSPAGILSQIVLLVLATVLAIYVLGNRQYFRLPTFRSLAEGLLWAASTVAGIAVLRALLDQRPGTLPVPLGRYLLYELVSETSLITVIEESYYRGLIYGLLLLLGWKQERALLVQAGLFFGSHYLLIATDPVLFFVLIPVYTVVASITLRKYHMLYVPIMVHTANNVLGGILSTMLSSFF